MKELWLQYEDWCNRVDILPSLKGFEHWYTDKIDHDYDWFRDQGFLKREKSAGLETFSDLPQGSKVGPDPLTPP